MYSRVAITAALLLLPALADAQRFPMPRIGRGPARPAPLPPQPGTIAREMAYVRLPISVESYPLVSYFNAPSFAAEGMVSSWTSLGVGTRAEYRLTPNISATLDMTSSVLGGPALTQTAELGTRLRPEASERRVYPFADLRVAYVHALDAPMRRTQIIDPFWTSAYHAPNARFSHGPAVVAGVGVEYSVTRTISVTTAASAIRSRLTAYGFRSGRAASGSYMLDGYRYTLGVRFNPVRLMPPTDLPFSQPITFSR